MLSQFSQQGWKQPGYSSRWTRPSPSCFCRPVHPPRPPANAYLPLLCKITSFFARLIVTVAVTADQCCHFLREASFPSPATGCLEQLQRRQRFHLFPFFISFMKMSRIFRILFLPLVSSLWREFGALFTQQLLLLFSLFYFCGSE